MCIVKPRATIKKMSQRCKKLISPQQRYAVSTNKLIISKMVNSNPIIWIIALNANIPVKKQSGF